MFSHKCYSWFSHDVTKIHTKELLILLSFKRYYWTAPKHLCLNKVLVRKVSSFCDRGRPSKEHKHGVSIQSFINLDKTFFRISHIWNIARTWFLARPFAIYLLLFPRFWTFCIEWFAILFLIAWQWKPRIASGKIINSWRNSKLYYYFT